MGTSFNQVEVKEVKQEWKHPLLPEEPLTTPGKDGDDAPLYLERNIQRVLKKLEEIENEEGEE